MTQIRTEAVSAVINYLITMFYVERGRIGGMDICADAGEKHTLAA
jgi:hypothetical protein